MRQYVRARHQRQTNNANTMETREPEAPATASAPPTTSVQLADDWLKGESTKLMLSLLDDRRKARRAALVLLWLAAAYVGVAAIGHVQTESANASRLEHASKELNERKRDLSEAKSTEDNAFNEYLTAVTESETLAGQVMVASKDVEISKEVNALISDQTKDAQLRYDSVLKAHRAARDTLDKYNQEQQRRGDLRETPERMNLQQNLKHAQEQLEQAKDALAKAQNGDGVAGDSEPFADKVTGKPLVGQHRLRAQLQQLALAKQWQVRTESEWQKAQRELATANANYANANKEHEKLEHDPAPLTLPVLSLAVAPAHFFLFAPLVLLALYWNIVAKDRMITRSLRNIIARLGTELSDDQAIVQVVPEIESARSGLLGKVQVFLPDLVAVVTVGMLACLGPMLVPLLAIVALLITVGFRFQNRSPTFAPGPR